MTAIIDWVMSKFGLYLLLAIALIYGAKKGYEHYTELSANVSTLTQAVNDRDATIGKLNTDVLQASETNSDLRTKLDTLKTTYIAISNANAKLQDDKAFLSNTLNAREIELAKRIAANAENDQCINADIPSDIISLLDDAEREARASTGYYQNGN